MNCPKCSGCMTPDQSLDFYMRGTALRCINCGTRREVVASVLHAPLWPTRSSRTNNARLHPGRISMKKCAAIAASPLQDTAGNSIGLC